MKLPNREYAYISLSKLKDYLLSETHPIGKSKARLFRSLGFNETNVEMLKEGLLNIGYSSDVVDMTMTPHGVKYLIDGILTTPNKGYIELRSVWIIDNGQVLPRFVTAYPA